MSDIREICSLSDEELEARQKELREELVPHIRSRAALPDGVALAFDATPDCRRQLEDFLAFERGCCAGLRFALREKGSAIQLEIRGLDPESSVFMEAAPEERPPPGGASGLARVARAGGLGAIGAFVLFCGLPIAAVAIAGAELAAPLGILDHPLVLSLGTLLFAGGVWRWEQRRAKANTLRGRCGC